MINVKKSVHFLKAKIFPLLPIGFIEYRDYKREHSNNYFLGGYKEYSASKSSISAEKYPIERNYKQVINVSGFGYSGSGAVVDLFAECDNCLTVGDSDQNTFDKVDVTIGFETDFIRLAGGLFEIEKFLGCKNFYLNDALINRFVKCVESFPPFKEDIRVRHCFYDFFDEIVEFKILDLKWNAYNSFLYPHKKGSCIYFLKNLSIQDYRDLANKLLVKLFNILNYSNADYLVFDQLLSDGELDTEKNNCYIKNVKSIFVYRDPRDVYAFAKKTDMAWIAHDTVENFIMWYTIMVRNLNFDNPSCMIVQFERLVTNYDEEIKKIFRYVGVDETLHNPIKRYKRFNPNFSIRNIGIWKMSDVPPSDYNKIENSLGKYCFIN